MARPRGGKRYGSRPAILPRVKDKLTPNLLEGIDKLGELLKLKSTQSTSWKTIKGNSRAPWVALTRFRGSWDWNAIHRAFRRFSKPDAKHLISYRRLVYCAMHFDEYDRKGNIVRSGWFSVTTTTTWENMLVSLIELSSETSRVSHAVRYERSIITGIVFSWGSKAVPVRWLDE